MPIVFFMINRLFNIFDLHVLGLFYQVTMLLIYSTASSSVEVDEISTCANVNIYSCSNLCGHNPHSLLQKLNIFINLGMTWLSFGVTISDMESILLLFLLNLLIDHTPMYFTFKKICFSFSKGFHSITYS